MANTAWPAPDKFVHIGGRHNRIDGPAKVSGAAKYAYDIVPSKDLLYAKMLPSPHANAKIKSIDTSEVEKMDGVVAVVVEKDRRGNIPEIAYAGQVIATVCATTEELAQEAIHHIKVDYEVLPHIVTDDDLELASGREQERESGDIAKGFEEADKIVEGHYGVACITHCCLEAHGQVMEFKDGNLYAWPSTQNVSGYAGAVSRDADVPDSNIVVDCQYMGGGFGSKFGPDQWGGICARLAKETGKPVKLMLERDQELMIAGHRPSGYADVKIGVKNDGTITAWDSKAWGSQGQSTWRMPPLPYVIENIPNTKTWALGIKTNRGSARAWRAPNHPQGCLITMAALEDAAAAIGMDALEFLKANLKYSELPDRYAEELDIAADMIGYKDKAHLRTNLDDGPVKRGLGISIHEWGGAGHPSNCDVTVNPDGSVLAQLGTQDLGTGTRTAVNIVVAETLGLPLDRVKVEIGRNAYPVSRASGGSTTIGGVSASSRDASTKALNEILAKAANELGVEAGKLEAANGQIREIGNPSKSMSWEAACKLIGRMPLKKTGSNPPDDGTKLTEGGAGGCQIADVSVDVETGIVTMNEMVAVQDCGIVINVKAAESQVYGAMIMGITSALYEETVFDVTTGKMLNADLEFYRLAGLGDVGTLKVHMMTGPGYNDTHVTGLGEPPAISPMAAISNAVANACGVRVPTLPLTPDRVLNALTEGGVA